MSSSTDGWHEKRKEEANTMRMKTYEIDFFGEKQFGFYGLLEDAKEYAESYMKHLLLTCKGSIKIMHGETVVAEQEWVTERDEFGEYSRPLEWS